MIICEKKKVNWCGARKSFNEQTKLEWSFWYFKVFHMTNIILYAKFMMTMGDFWINFSLYFNASVQCEVFVIIISNNYFIHIRRTTVITIKFLLALKKRLRGTHKLLHCHWEYQLLILNTRSTFWPFSWKRKSNLVSSLLVEGIAM